MGIWDQAFGDCGVPSSSALGAGLVEDVIHEIGANTEGDCKVGELQMQQLAAFYQQAGAPAQFADSVAALQASYDHAEASWSRKLLPFSTVCGQIKAIGGQAAALTQQIAQATGQQPPPVPVVEGGTLRTLVVAGITAYVAVELGKKAIDVLTTRRQKP